MLSVLFCTQKHIHVGPGPMWLLSKAMHRRWQRGCDLLLASVGEGRSRLMPPSRAGVQRRCAGICILIKLMDLFPRLVAVRSRCCSLPLEPLRLQGLVAGGFPEVCSVPALHL